MQDEPAAYQLVGEVVAHQGDIDGLAYVKSADDELLQAKGATTPVPLTLLRDVADSAKECPGDCIHVRRVSDSVEVYGPDAE